MELSSDEVTRLCQDLVYKVAYAFYDSPYIILLRVLVVHNVVSEKKLSEILAVVPNDVRKYLGMLHVHRLVKRHVNKERLPQSNIPSRQNQYYQTPREFNKLRDVIYWYLDYREFADVVKYRIAMMRRAIDEKIKSEVGKRGYICPNCSREYDPLDLAHTFDPQSNAFLCEVCSTELVEDDPSFHVDQQPQGASQDRMQRFNLATAPIRDALKAVEGQRIPSINILAWIAQNVRTETVVDGEGAEGKDGRRVDVVFGVGDDNEAKERLAEEQRVQNALPVWYTHSTITGDATTLGLKNAGADGANGGRSGARRTSGNGAALDEDDALAAHYANMDDDDENEFEETEIPSPPTPPTPGPAILAEDDDTPGADVPEIMVYVGGVAKALAEVTESDEDLMTPDEYEKYFEVTSAAL